MTATAASVEAVRVLAPLISEHADSIESERWLPESVVRAMRDAGVFRSFIPRALGGAEADPVTFCRVVEELASADGSTGWYAMLCGSSSSRDPTSRFSIRGMSGGCAGPGATTTGCRICSCRTTGPAGSPRSPSSPAHSTRCRSSPCPPPSWPALEELAAVKTPARAQTVLREDPVARSHIGEAEGLLRAGQAFVYRTLEEAPAGSIRCPRQTPWRN